MCRHSVRAVVSSFGQTLYDTDPDREFRADSEDCRISVAGTIRTSVRRAQYQLLVLTPIAFADQLHRVPVADFGELLESIDVAVRSHVEDTDIEPGVALENARGILTEALADLD